MAIDPAAAESPSTAPRFSVDLGRPLPNAGGGIEAWAATDSLDPSALLMALPVTRDAPIRADVLEPLKAPIDQLLLPVGHGPGPSSGGTPAYYLFSQAPTGSPLSADLRPWSEAALLSMVLRPIAQVMVELETRGLTHRAIRLNNVFRGLPDTPVVLGAAWSEPPAFRQPALFDPPYSAACHPHGRGNGGIADDVYALGVLLIVLALGRLPLARLDETAIIERKLSMGSFPALTNDEKLPAIIGDLARNMLAEDPEHRPPPALLLDPIAARGRRVAARPPHRASRPLKLGQSQIWDARGLAFAIGRDPNAAMQAIRSGETTQWLRRGLGDAGLAARLEEFQRHRVSEGPSQDAKLDNWLLMRVIAQIDPLAPMTWCGLSFWPDALGPLMAAGPDCLATVTEVVATDAVAQWNAMREERSDTRWSRADGQRQHAIMQVRGPSGGPPRLLYALNPLLPCQSPLLEGHWVVSLADLPPVLNDTVGQLSADSDLLDNHLLAFIGIRGERRLDIEVNTLNGRLTEPERLIALLRLMAALQSRYWSQPLPGLSAWFVARGRPLVVQWHHRPTREAVAAELARMATQGLLMPILTLVADTTTREADFHGATRARRELAGIDLELAAIAGGTEARATYARRVGQEIVAGVGLTALAAMLVLAAIG